MTVLHLDIETRSRVDLRKYGVYRYVEDPDWWILMAAWALDDGPVRVAFTAEELDTIPGLWDRDVLKMAHNANFERVNFSRLHHALHGGPWPSFLHPREWDDSQALAAEHGYPQMLKYLAPAVGGEEKDEAGTRLINLFSKPNRAGGWNTPQTHPEQWAEFVAYCRQDVSTMRDALSRMPSWPTRAERATWIADQLVNDRGIRVDLPMVQESIRAAEENTEDARDEVVKISGVQNPGSVIQLLAWLNEQGLRSVGDLQAATVEKALKSRAVNSGSEKANRVRRVLELRQELALATSKKYTAITGAVSCDQRLRGQFRFFGAHTGRWSGRGVQLQNLAREALGSHKIQGEACSCGLQGATEEHASRANDAEVEATVLDLLLGERVDNATLKKLVRSSFLLGGVVVDYAAIEARVIAWLAGEEWALKAFRDGRDIYVETAERMGRVLGTTFTRAQGKVAVLALGYQGGIGSLRAMGAEGTDEDLQKLVDAWRAANPSIVAFWAALQEAFRKGGRAGRLRVEIHGWDSHVILPSGRAVVYHNVILDDRVRVKVGAKYKAKTADTFADPKIPNGRTLTYGGRLAENATQAVARDLLAAALVRLERAGFEPVGHVHDEVLVQGTEDVAEVSRLMCQSPTWADGLPVDGEGFRAYRYKKG